MDIDDILGLSMLGVLLLTGLVEVILSGTWNKTYFTTGIQIFVIKIPVELRHSNIPSSQKLEARFYSSWSSSLVFNEIESHTYGFREKLFEFRLVRYSPIMHGILVFDRETNEVVVKGYVNWFILAFSLIWLGGVLLSSIPSFPIIALGFILFFVFLMGLLYWIQHNRFSKVAMFAAETWSRKYVRDVVGA